MQLRFKGLFVAKIKFPWSFDEWHAAFPVDDSADENPNFIAMSKFLKDNYGEVGSDVFWNYCIGKARSVLNEQDWKDFDSTTTRRKLQSVYNDAKFIPLKWVTKSIGSGCFGVVVPYGKIKVKKIFYQPMNQYERKFYNYCKTGRSNVFPKVFKVTEEYIIMEKLKPETETVKDFVDGCLFPEQFEESAEFEEIKIWGDAVKKELYYLFGIKGYGDLNPANVGERFNGDIIYFDPVGGKDFLDLSGI